MKTHNVAGMKPVAYLRFYSTRPGSSRKMKNVFRNQQLDIGREDVKQLLGIEALTVSTHHLRLRCIVYEENDEHAIAPMIYFRVLSFNSVELDPSGAGRNTSTIVSRGQGDILLGEGDVIKLTHELFVQFHYWDRSVALHNALDEIQRAEAKCFADRYLLSGRRLGKGTYGSVFIAVKQSTQRQFACKAVPTPNSGKYSCRDDNKKLRLTAAQREAKVLEQRQKLAREYVILEKLDHPNIVSLEKVFCATYNIYIVQELITGGDLLSHLSKNGPLPEAHAAAITFQVLKAVEYLHSNGYVHRDIKPENILLASWRDGSRVVLTDFGQSIDVGGERAAQTSSNVLRMQSLAGTPGYTAPELLKLQKVSVQQHSYTEVVDIWSVGCVTAGLLTGDTLFSEGASGDSQSNDSSDGSICGESWDVNIIDKHRLWTDVGQNAKDFVKGCLAKAGGQRFSAKQALRHDWFVNKHYAAELAAAYERAIADWQPRKQGGRVIEFFDTTNVMAASSTSTPCQSPWVKSKHFQSLPPSPVNTPATNSTAFAFRRKPPVPLLPPMRPGTKVTSQGEPASQQGLKNSISTNACDFGNRMSFCDYTDSSHTAQLSIKKYAPPATQYTVQPTGSAQHFVSGTQSQWLLDGPTQTQLTMTPHAASISREGLGVVALPQQWRAAAADGDERPWKKACR